MTSWEKTINSSGTDSKTQAKSSEARRRTSEKVLEYIKNNPQIIAHMIAILFGLSTRGVEKHTSIQVL